MIRGYVLMLSVLTMLLPGATHSAPQVPVVVVGVDQIMKEPQKYPGTLVVEGVVKTFSKKDHAIVLIDVEEYRKCRVVTCSLLALPVQWTGEMPAVLDTVRVEGEVTTVNSKLLFAARKLKKVLKSK